MRMYLGRLSLIACLLLLPGGVAVPGEKDKPPAVPVSQPLQRNVTDHLDFTGRAEAAVTVTIRARVTGYLEKTRFKEGAEVRQGDVLFEIDPRPYQAEYDLANAKLALSEAKLRRATAELDQAKKLVQTKVISEGEVVKLGASRDEAEAAVRAAQASLTAAKLTLGFTRVVAPRDGVIGRSLLAPGNLVRADDTVLAEIVSTDPVYVYFDVDERRLLTLIDGGKLVKAGGDKIRVLAALPGEDGYPHEGVLDFVDNRVNPETGTIRMRGVFANPGAAPGGRKMVPGMYVRVRLPRGEPHPALLVADAAILADQGQKFLYVVDADNRVQRRDVTVGPPEPGGLRVIASGLKGGEWVAVGNQQRVRPQQVVRPERIAMPTTAGAEKK